MKKRVFLALATVLFVQACGFSRPSTFYVLDGDVTAQQSLPPQDNKKVLIGIESVFVPAYLNKPQIVIRQPDNITLTASEYNRWAEQIGEVFPRVLAASMSFHAGYPVAKQIYLNRDLFPSRLFVEILRFDAAFDKEAVLDVWWTVVSKSGDVVYRTRTVFAEPTGKSYDSVVQAEQKLIDKLGKTVTDYILQREKGNK